MASEKNIEELFSAGGVVLHTKNAESTIVVCERTSQEIWALPKGTPEVGESLAQTALREVSEETGLEVEIQLYIGKIDYSFVRIADSKYCHKTVFYYLMSAIGGDTNRHDHEFDEVRLVPPSAALELLTYENEVEVVREALSMVDKIANNR